MCACVGVGPYWTIFVFGYTTLRYNGDYIARLILFELEDTPIFLNITAEVGRMKVQPLQLICEVAKTGTTWVEYV